MSDQKINLSHKTCDRVFKNVLRGKPENVRYIFYFILLKFIKNSLKIEHLYGT
jgi:hypothetical protein